LAVFILIMKNNRTTSEKSSKKLGIIEEKGIGADGSLESSLQEEEGPRSNSNTTTIITSPSTTRPTTSTTSEKSSKLGIIEEKGIGADGSPRRTTTTTTTTITTTTSEKSSKKEPELVIIEEKGNGANGSLESSLQEEEGPRRAVNNAFGTLAQDLSMFIRVASSAVANGEIPLPVADNKSSPCLQLLQELARMLLVVIFIALQRVFMNCVEVSVSIGELPTTTTTTTTTTTLN
jgi:hypothetical protein